MLISGSLCGVPSGGNQSTPPTLPGNKTSSGPQQPFKRGYVSCMEGMKHPHVYFSRPFESRGVKSFSAVTKKGEHVCLLAGFLGGEKSHTNFDLKRFTNDFSEAELNTNGPAPASCFSNVFAAPAMSGCPTRKLRINDQWFCFIRVIFTYKPLSGGVS